MLHLTTSCNYYLYAGHTDMRKGFDGFGIIKSQLSLIAPGGSVSIFINRRRTQVKLLLREGDGFAIYYKRLELGTFELPVNSTQSPAVALDARQLQCNSNFYKCYFIGFGIVFYVNDIEPIQSINVIFSIFTDIANFKTIIFI